MRLTVLVEEEKKVALNRPLGVAFMTLGQLLFYHDFMIYIYIYNIKFYSKSIINNFKIIIEYYFIS